jgi:hypothetical protein
MNRDCFVLGIPADIELMELVAPAEGSGEPELWGFLFGERVHLISRIVNGWTTGDHRYIEVAVHDGGRFMLRYDAATDKWTASAVVRTGVSS